jgi:hypothetical protein
MSVDNVENWPEPGPFVGRDAVMRQWQEQRDGVVVFTEFFWDHAEALETLGLDG